MTLSQLMETDGGNLSEELLVFIESSELGKCEAAELIELEPAVLARRIKDLPDFLEKFPQEKRKLTPLAIEILAIAKRGVRDSPKVPQAAPAPSLPVAIKLVTDKKLYEMSLRELLDYLAKNPESWGEIEPQLAAKADFNAARVKSDRLAVLATGKFDPALSADYVAQLAKPGASPLKKHKGNPVVTFQKVLGLDEKVLQNPFTGEPTSGPDPDFTTASGDPFEWNQLPKEQLEAIIWARDTGHKFFPGPASGSYFDEVNALINGSPSARMQRIFADYKDAKDEDDSFRVDIYWKRKLATHGHAGFEDGQRSSRTDTVTAREASMPIVGVGTGGLTGPQVQELVTVIRGAFDFSTLEQAVLFGTNVELSNIVRSGGTFATAAQDVVLWFARRNQIPTLVAALRAQNSGNSDLAAIGRRYGC